MSDERNPVEVLTRWEDHGAVWRVVDRSASRVTVALCRCDGGEEVDRLVSDDPDLLAFVDERVRTPRSP
ncbi:MULTISPECIES: hypothetical protein [Nocardiopsidaceae]|uniref:Uncharacterized protein n=2 Tax=Nocardiopsidaceae TaxID=83676 RepID=A0ABY6YR99_9ACTN|nr:hypothetical protein [Streptomonospora nanhaiensis]MEE2046581.1 hypothetical protein [Nocardiopsis tropica]WAE74869.1 hypothetical protein OUQ99_07155 [Streptomonospora nanhaiensis]